MGKSNSLGQKEEWEGKALYRCSYYSRRFSITESPILFECCAWLCMFFTFDITSGYHQVPVKREDVPKTAFITKYGLYEFKDHADGAEYSECHISETDGVGLTGT
jgi:hypothetical protein